MNLEYLKTFQDIVRLGSFSEVARQLGISQPAVSFQVQKLEQELGTPLIDRAQRAITLTAAGKRLLRFTESILEERELLRRDLEQMREKVAGELAVTASTIPGEFLLPGLLARFRRRHPAVSFQLSVSDSGKVIDAVGNGTCEVGFCGLKPPGAELKSIAVAGDEIVLIVFPEHPFAGRPEIMPAELEGEPLVYREATSGTQRHLENRLAQAGLDQKTLRVDLKLGSTQAVVAAVEAGAGIAFVSSLAVKKSLSLGLVRQVAVSGFDLKRDFYCIYRPERIDSRLLREFVDFVQIEASERAK